MIIKVLYFASLKEELNLDEEDVELQDNSTINDLIKHLQTRGEEWQEALADSKKVRAALNQEFTQLNDKLANNDEVALFPPVTGG